MRITRSIFGLFFFLIYLGASGQTNTFYKEKYRPQFHFTPAIHWTNDPNGLVYLDGEYHLFYQYNPFGIRWGHMSWGHAISKDLVHWQHYPVAIGEEKDTMIFSGSAVVDKNNSSGFGSSTQVPLIAIYTAHIQVVDSSKKPSYSQSQHLAYSLDKGRTWTKYNKNPILDLGKKDFRDPAVFWYDAGKKWVMVAAWPIERQLQFYTSQNLKDWKWMSSFGPAGETIGIWECPDLFEVPIQGEPGKTKWVLMHSPAPYMQYFVGEFDGTGFKNENPAGKIYRPDYGADYYAAITYKSLPADHVPISIGWVNNWNYAENIPTSPWKSAMSLPRELAVKKIGDEWILVQQPAKQLTILRGKESIWKLLKGRDIISLPVKSQTFEIEMEMVPGKSKSSGIRIAKGAGQYLEIGYNGEKGELYMDRSKAGNTNFDTAFAQFSPFATKVRTIGGNISLHIFYDKSIVEVFVNGGEQVMTMQIFPGEKDDAIELFKNGGDASFQSVKFWNLKSIWQ